VASRNLNTRYGSHVKQLRQKRQEEREEQALRVSQVQKVMQKKLEERQEQAEDRHAFECEMCNKKYYK